jgi:hypothetical protein
MMDLFDNVNLRFIVGYLTSLAISRLAVAKLRFLREFIRKLKFPNKSNE